jgi:ribonuclease D
MPDKREQGLITTSRALEEYCRRLADAPRIAFDTEFVSEDTYRSHLCLVQVAIGDELTAIDAMAVTDLAPFWEVIAAPGHVTIVHAGREESLFCLESTGKFPNQLVDVQIAAGLIGLEYPAGYGNLISRLLGATPDKGETRTDWRRRPLTEKQIIYALADAKHLEPLYEVIGARLDTLGRREWFADEMLAWQEDVRASRSKERWRKVSGSSGLSSRCQAIVRELWLWREGEAEKRNCPVRRVIRDDLIVELAKRRSDDPKQIRAIRGMEYGQLGRAVPELARAIETALNLPDSECPKVIRQDTNPQLMMLGQFLSTALSSICRKAEVAASLVGTANDVRELVAYLLDGQDVAPGAMPLLATGWRAEVVGQLLEDLLFGKASIRIQNPNSEQPLVFEPVEKKGSK